MADTKIVRFLLTIPVFQGLTPNQIEALANILRLQLVPPKGNLFKEGEPGDSFFFIIEGEVGVFKKLSGAGQQQLAALGPREPVGHLCLIDGQPRSATCTAIQRTLVLRGDRRLFDRLFTQGDTMAFRFIDAIARDLCVKLRSTNQMLFNIFSRPEETAEQLRQMLKSTLRPSENSARELQTLAQAKQPAGYRNAGAPATASPGYVR